MTTFGTSRRAAPPEWGLRGNLEAKFQAAGVPFRCHNNMMAHHRMVDRVAQNLHAVVAPIFHFHQKPGWPLVW
jgi:hypothetical protein